MRNNILSSSVNYDEKDYQELLHDTIAVIGLSPRNLWDMKRFYLRYYQEDTKLRQAVAVLPWGHNLLLLNSDLLSEHILFYANEVISKSWSRNMLNLALKSEYHLSIQASEKSNNFW